MDLKLRSDFPIFSKYPKLTYLDSAATSQKPKTVIDAVSNFYSEKNSNVHRGIYDLAEIATDSVEGARKKIAKFINATSEKEIIFTSNASESINLVAFGWARKFLKKGDFIITTEMEHHSNLIPWIRLQNEIGIKLYYLPVTKDYTLDFSKIINSKIPKNRIKLVTLTHASNVLGTVNPVADIINFLKASKIKAKFLIDAAQSIPHMRVDVKKLDCDFLVFSGHKMLGPSGVGVLWAKQKLLNNMQPMLVGSHMVETVTKNSTTWAPLPAKFEVGTGRLEAITGLGAAVDYLQKIGMNNIEQNEKLLTKYMLEKLKGIEGVKIIGKTNEKERVGVISFAIDNIHPHDISEILNRKNICIRAGNHCAQPLMKALGVTGTARASLYIYNTKKDVDMLIEGIIEVKKILKNG